jgi:hypothetical protein
MRKYQSAWNQLRDNHTQPLVISAHPAYHRRIYKAIIKEKNIDTVHHLVVSELGKESKLSRKSDGNALTITLTISVALHGIF